MIVAEHRPVPEQILGPHVRVLLRDHVVLARRPDVDVVHLRHRGQLLADARRHGHAAALVVDEGDVDRDDETSSRASRGIGWETSCRGRRRKRARESARGIRVARAAAREHVGGSGCSPSMTCTPFTQDGKRGCRCAANTPPLGASNLRPLKSRGHSGLTDRVGGMERRERPGEEEAALPRASRRPKTQLEAALGRECRGRDVSVEREAADGRAASRRPSRSASSEPARAAAATGRPVPVRCSSGSESRSRTLT